ncbi:mycofactocin dehydrogenase MftG [Nocardia carnea]|uniref:mycofactocin dehydrogenase MftG n=1 Tax=Nocardia carnea TaxID=37328 RepID=UPI0024546005|nr:mycofactocin system GMC family oxidoreductase MftG [Nocardia carnea]
MVGAGSTGGALAARLSEDPSRSVLLLEGGPVYASASHMPSALLSPSSIAAGAPGHPNNWAYPAELLPGMRLPYPRGKGLGGSSSINGCYFIRGTRADFDSWAEQGNEAWAFDRVLPSFKRVETDHDFKSDAHGNDGPVAIMREPLDRAPEFTSAFHSACKALGFDEEPDKNDPDAHRGVGPVPLNVADGLRAGTALAYLLPAAGRENLTILGDAPVLQIVTTGQRAVGVVATVDSTTRTFYADEIVLSAGALRTPHLLMVSGIGPADELRKHNIDVVQDLPGVGMNLTDHPMASAAWDSNIPFTKYSDRGVLTSVLHWADEGSELEILPFVTKNGDMLSASDVLERPRQALSAMKSTSIKAVTRQAKSLKHAMLGIVVLEEESRGRVSLASGNPGDLPVLQWNLLSSEADRVRFRAAVRMAYELFQSSELRLIGASINGLDAKTVKNDKAVDRWVAERINAGHPSCTCRMGPAGDPTAVVDQYLRVHGIEGLRVADTSAFPSIPTRGPNATAIMMGEHLAQMMAGQPS